MSDRLYAFSAPVPPVLRPVAHTAVVAFIVRGAYPNERTRMTMSSPFEVTIEERGDTVHVRLRGELDISTAARLEDDLRRIETDEPAILILDLSRLDFMDSTGLRLMISADSRARDAGRRFVLVQGNEMVRRVLRLTRLDERLEIVEDPGALAGA